MPHTNTCLSNIRFSQNDVLKVIRKLDPNKGHDHDKAFCKPLHTIFTSCLDTGGFPMHWKKANVIPIHKKESKQRVKNYCYISPLSICGKIFERLTYNEVYTWLIDSNLVSSHQSGFQGDDSCISQLLSITHEIYKSFEEGFEVRGVFLDISKAFNRVWHDGLIFKLQKNGVSGKLLLLLKDFLKSSKQRVVLNGQHSSWRDVNAGVPQGWILGHLFFLVYLNDFSKV